MASKDKILVDHEELTLVDPEDKNSIYKNFSKDRIRMIEFTTLKKKKFLRGEFETHRIIIHPSGMKDIIYDEDKEKENFNTYLESLREFAFENHIKVEDHLH